MPNLRFTSFPTSTSLLLARIMLERAVSVDLLASTFRRVFRLTWLNFTISMAKFCVNYFHRICTTTHTSMSLFRVTITLVSQ